MWCGDFKMFILNIRNRGITKQSEMKSSCPFLTKLVHSNQLLIYILFVTLCVVILLDDELLRLHNNHENFRERKVAG